MAGLVDGLGFEEIGQAGSQPSAIWVTGSIVTESVISGTDLAAANTISGGTAGIRTAGSITALGGLIVSKAISGQNIDIAGSAVAKVIEDSRGAVTSVAMASGNAYGHDAAAGTYGQIVQAGVVTISAGSECWAIFPKRFGGSYVIVGTQMTTHECGSTGLTTSGLRHVGSCLLIGQAGANYDWIAIGPGSHY